MAGVAQVSILPRATPQFKHSLEQAGEYPLTRSRLSEIQINVGKLCNQACNHCHVDAGPKRTEIMSRETVHKILHWMKQSPVKKVDITGGAPELNPHFRELVQSLVDQRIAVTSRCNLTVLFEENQSDLAAWYASRNVRLVCSLPCYSELNVDSQRGKGVFHKSIEALKQLNAAGYGIEDRLPLDLVYNPNGAFLPPDQTQLEQDYRHKLRKNHGIVFSRLLTLTNLPISRFRHFLERTNQKTEYEHLLADNFNAQTLSALMCRQLVSVDWLGRTYDCDFNQILGLSLPNNKYLWEIDVNLLDNQPIAIGNHCFGCTAGAGSSCGGALT